MLAYLHFARALYNLGDVELGSGGGSAVDDFGG